MNEDHQPPPLSPVLAARVVLTEALEKLAAAVAESAWAVSDAEARDLTSLLAADRERLEAVWLAAVRDLDSRPEAVPGARAGLVAQTFLVGALRRSPRQAARDVTVAHALDPRAGVAGQDLHADGEARAPSLGAALAAGQVSREHVDVAVHALRSLPRTLLRRVDPDGLSIGAKADTYLAEQARAMDPDGLRRVCGQLRAYLDPDHQKFDADAHERRFLSMRTGDDGMLLGRFAVPAVQGAAIKAALEAAAAPQPAAGAMDEHGQTALVRDERTKGQRLADALTAITSHWNGCSHDDARADTHVMVIADLDQVTAARAAREDRTGHTGHEGRTTGAASTRPTGGAGHAHCVQTGPVNALTLQALACDAVLQAVVLDRSGAVLQLGRTVRTVSAAQRRALIARDRGCVVPGCHAPPAACDAHHLRWWRHGGATDLENLALVCRRHHADIHAGIWTLEMIDGVPYGVPPRWANPDRRRLRNTVHHSDALVRHFATQLVIDLADPDAPADDRPGTDGTEGPAPPHPSGPG